jgi:hypothetical protein
MQPVEAVQRNSSCCVVALLEPPLSLPAEIAHVWLPVLYVSVTGSLVAAYTPTRTVAAPGISVQKQCVSEVEGSATFGLDRVDSLLAHRSVPVCRKTDQKDLQSILAGVPENSKGGSGPQLWRDDKVTEGHSRVVGGRNRDVLKARAGQQRATIENRERTNGMESVIWDTWRVWKSIANSVWLGSSKSCDQTCCSEGERESNTRYDIEVESPGTKRQAELRAGSSNARSAELPSVPKTRKHDGVLG